MKRYDLLAMAFVSIYLDSIIVGSADE